MIVLVVGDEEESHDDCASSDDVEFKPGGRFHVYDRCCWCLPHSALHPRSSTVDHPFGSKVSGSR